MVSVTNSRGVFIAGTDTAVGKTEVTLGLMAVLSQCGKMVTGMKPVASGCRSTASGLRNEDAERILAACAVPLDYSQVNPIPLEPPVAPHIAAEEAGTTISLNGLVTAYEFLCARSDFCIVEGIGGWLVPLNSDSTMADLVVQLELPVILVVGIRLGCLNHALLSVESIDRHGVALAGWVANLMSPETLRVDEIIGALKTRIHAPLLARVPWLPHPSANAFAACLRDVPASLTAGSNDPGS